MSLIVPRPMFLRVLDALRWSRVAWSSVALGVAFAAGALAAGILGKPPADVPTPVAMASVGVPARSAVPTRARKTAAAKRAKILPEAAGAKRETIGLAAVEAAAPSATAANPQAATSGARAQDQIKDQTSPSTSEAPLVASDTEPSDDAPEAQDAEAAQKAMKEARRAKRLAKRSRSRMLRAQLDADASQWADSDHQFIFRHQNGHRTPEPSFFLFGRFDNRNM